MFPLPESGCKSTNIFWIGKIFFSLLPQHADCKVLLFLFRQWRQGLIRVLRYALKLFLGPVPTSMQHQGDAGALLPTKTHTWKRPPPGGLPYPKTEQHTLIKSLRGKNKRGLLIGQPSFTEAGEPPKALRRLFSSPSGRASVVNNGRLSPPPQRGRREQTIIDDRFCDHQPLPHLKRTSPPPWGKERQRKREKRGEGRRTTRQEGERRHEAFGSCKYFCNVERGRRMRPAAGARSRRRTYLNPARHGDH